MKCWLCGRSTWAAGLTLVVGLALFAGLKWRASGGTEPSQNVPFDDGLSAGEDTRAVLAGNNESKSSAAAPTDLDGALELARHALKTLEKVKDYTCVFAKRELVGGDFIEERDTMKLRHEPLSVYLRVTEPTSSAGQEVIYVEGRNDGNLIAHTVGFGSSLIGRVHLDPEGIIAKRGNRYSIKDVGLKNLVKKLINLGSRKELFHDSTVKIEQTEFAERACTQVEISSPHPIGDFRLATARIVIDRDWDVPVHYEAYEWPADGEKPFLSETYSYYDLKFDVGLTDRDFDPDNPEYSFP
ncbi:MAG TPA: DUF1571 domain-containing protein [Pirellulales bacterium]|jgi:hypothetical protein|nr:DUF1571 domain-containing protein [Pirellulales bacterium]